MEVMGVLGEVRSLRLLCQALDQAGLQAHGRSDCLERLV